MTDNETNDVTPTEAVTTTETVAVNTAAPKKAARKAARKAANPKGGDKKPKAKKEKASKPAKSAKPRKEKTTVVSAGSSGPVEKSSNPLHNGSTRSRLFKALKKFGKLSATAIKQRTGMLPNSGHLAVLLGEEVEAKRIKAEHVDGDPVTYSLTKTGLKAVEEGTVDKRKAGSRIGQAWTKARVHFEETGKTLK